MSPSHRSSPHIDPDDAEAYDLPTDAEIDAELSRLEVGSGGDASRQAFLGSSSFGDGGGGGGGRVNMEGVATASQYRLQKGERLRGVANRIIFSRYYVLFYGIMMVLSLFTVVLSLMARGGCPSVTWHILEVVINALMVLEVGTRWVAYGKKYPMTPLNVIDLLLVLFCAITLIVTFTSPCSDGSMSEERLDTILLVVRNAVQFLRIVNILRRSGHSILNPPKPIDLSSARPAALGMDLELDMSDDEEAAAERTLFSGGSDGRSGSAGVGGRYEAIPMYADGIADDDSVLETGTGPGQGQDRGGGGGGGLDRRGSGRGDEHDGSDGTRSKGKWSGIGNGNGTGNAGIREGLSEGDQETWDRLG